jgi:hypothetical protein
MATSTYRYEALLPDCSLLILPETATIRNPPRLGLLIAWLAAYATSTGRLDSGSPDHKHPTAREELSSKGCGRSCRGRNSVVTNGKRGTLRGDRSETQYTMAIFTGNAEQ